jgi:hypothetical protein
MSKGLSMIDGLFDHVCILLFTRAFSQPDPSSVMLLFVIKVRPRLCQRSIDGQGLAL